MKILVVGLSNVGDAILSYPAIQAVMQSYPQAKFHVLASPRTRELYENDPRWNRVWIWQKKANWVKQAGQIGRLFNERFDLCVDFRQTLIPFLILARRSPILLRVKDRRIHRIDLHWGLVRAMGMELPNHHTPLPYKAEDESNVAHWLGEATTPYVVVSPGARSHLKRWAAARFADLADRLIGEKGFRVVLVGDKGEAPIADQVEAAMKQKPLNWTGRTTLSQLFVLLKGAKLVLTNDSACLHAAQAMGTPTVAIFGPTDEKKYGPRNANSRVARMRLTCAPCEQALCAYNHECMSFLDVPTVWDSIEKVLSS